VNGRGTARSLTALLLPRRLRPRPTRGRTGTTLGGALIFGLLLALLGSGIARAEVQRTITSAYTLGDAGNSDCDVRIAAGGGAFYLITARSASNYPPGCGVRITNIDPMPSGTNATGAKFVNFVDCTLNTAGGTYLWPGQTLEATTIDGAWIATRCPGLWQMPGGDRFVVNWDPIDGSDTWGAADGLSTGPRAFKSAFFAMARGAQLFSALFGSSYTVRCSYHGGSCSGQTDDVAIHWPLHDAGPLGSQGRAGIILDCNGAVLAGDPSIALYFAASILEMQNCNISKGIFVSEGAELILNGSNNTFTPIADGFVFTVKLGSKVFSNNATINLTAGTGAGLFNVEGSTISGPSVNLDGNVTWTTAGVVVKGGYASPATKAWKMNGFTVAGRRYLLELCGVATGTADLPGTGLGSATCRQAN
jgi:hypothetical protein